MPDTPALRKARGAFYTPAELSRFIARWAVRAAGDRVMEPSCGEAEFLVAAAARLREFGASELLPSEQLQGVELHAPAAAAASERLRSAGFSSEIEVSDFFDVKPAPVYDAVVGNPPYVRYQQFSGNARRKGLEAALAHGVRLTGLASSWAPFVVHATRFLKPQGRLGLVLPAELLTVNYAASVRAYLLDRFRQVRLVVFEERVFPGVLEEVILLLAEGSGGAPGFELVHARNLDSLDLLDGAPRTWVPADLAGKWTPALLDPEAYELYRSTAAAGFAPLAEWGGVYLGGVTGNNDFFALTCADAAERGIPRDELLPISPPGSRHLRTTEFTPGDWERLSETGARCFLFSPDRERPSPAALRYIAEGERAAVPAAYKCRVRSPWWKVPTVRVADLFLTYMNHEGPRLVANRARVHHLNSVHGVALKPDVAELGRDLLPLASLNSLTLLSAELVGRSYGGGLLKMEPREAGRWIVPAPATLQECHDALERLRREAGVRKDAAWTTDAVDQVLLRECLGISSDHVDQLRASARALRARRITRAGASRGAR